MKNNKGFTLIELLAMLTVLGILMVITIPNITGILKNSRSGAMRNDAENMINKAKVKSETIAKLKKPKENFCVVFSLSYLNDDKDITTGPNGGIYNQYESFVVFTRIGQKYKYYVKLVEETEDGNFGINVSDEEFLNKMKNKGIVQINNTLGLNNNKEESKEILNTNKPQIGYGESVGTTLCLNGVTEYYS